MTKKTWQKERVVVPSEEEKRAGYQFVEKNNLGSKLLFKEKVH